MRIAGLMIFLIYFCCFLSYFQKRLLFNKSDLNHCFLGFIQSSFLKDWTIWILNSESWFWSDLIHGFCFIEEINSCKTHACAVSLVIVNVGFWELIIIRVLILWLSSFFDESVGDNLGHLDTVVGLVAVDFPFEDGLFRVELHSEKRVFSGLPNTNELFIVRWSGLTD